MLASLLNDPSVLSAGWEPDRILDKLWYENALARVREVLSSVDADERRALEQEFLDVVRTWLDGPRFALVEAVVLESDPPPVLPICLLASILDGWKMLSPERMHTFLDGSELGDLFVDVLKDGQSLHGLAEWGRRITLKDDAPCKQALHYLQHEVFPKHPSAVTESLATVVKGVGGKGSERLLNQLIQVLEADGGILAQGLAVTLHALLDVVVNGERADTLPLEKAPCKLTDALETPDAPEWEELLETLHYELTQYWWPVLAKFRALVADILPDAGMLEDSYIRSMGLWMVDSANALLNYIPIFLILFSLIAILEDSGYMARIAFILDKLLHLFGLHGQSTLPYILGGVFAGGCAVPGVMATKGIPDHRSRMATILTVPYMNCLAKIPFYTLIINVFFAPYKSWAMLFLSTITIFVALLVARLLTATI